MRKIQFVFLLVSLTFINCYTAQVGNPSLTYFLNKGTSGFSGTKNDAGDKMGEACATSTFLMFFAYGDASIQKAASAGGITKISSVSHETKMGHFFQDVCTIVRGQ